MHGGKSYNPEWDIWGNKAERGTGLYSGFVNCADPEIQTPFEKVFKIIRNSAQPSAGIVYGAMEIDIPCQHPRLEIMCAVMYLKYVHGIEIGLPRTYDDMVARVFKKA